jgi:hypothetical protein
MEIMYQNRIPMGDCFSRSAPTQRRTLQPSHHRVSGQAFLPDGCMVISCENDVYLTQRKPRYAGPNSFALGHTLPS